MKLNIILLLLLFSFYNATSQVKENKVREFHDSIGFAKHNWQMDSIISRIDPSDKQFSKSSYKAVINAHDDYAYAAGLYAKTLAGIKANTIVLIGVAHSAGGFNLQDRVIFGSFKSWEAPYGDLKVSSYRNKLISNITQDAYLVHDSIMQQEHSLEAIIPFLQKNNPNVEIIPILIPFMKFKDMKSYSDLLSKGLFKIMQENNLKYGKDLAVVISNDAIHYGSEDWGGFNLAPFGTDSTGNAKAHQKDLQIIDETLKGDLSTEKIKMFNSYTVNQDNYKEYQWTWCGRYSVPFGLLLANKLNILSEGENLSGTLIDYRSSLKDPHIKVNDLGMGTTAPAKSTHWVAYLGMAYQ